MNHFIKGKVFLLILVLAGGGLLLTFMGVVNNQQTRQLIAQGKPSTATVVERKERIVYKESKSHHLVLEYQTDDGSTVSEIMVPLETYNSVAVGGTVNVIYDPGDPSLCKLAGTLQVSYDKIILGSVFTGLGILVFVFVIKKPNLGLKLPMTEDEIAEKVRPQAATQAQKLVEGMAPLMGDRHVFEAVDARKFTNLDLKFYDDQRRLMESRGYQYLQDSEDVTLRNGKFNPKTFTRVMLRRDGLVSVDIYHFKPPMLMRVLGVKELKVLNLMTPFTNGTYVSTSNGGDVPQLSQPVEIKDLALPGKTSFEQLIAFHQQRIDKHGAETGASAVRMEGLAGIRKADGEIWRLKANHRKQVGLTRDDFQNLAGTKGKNRASDLLYEEVRREFGGARLKAKG
jgi:Protein of unknown function (DUF3592)